MHPRESRPERLVWRRVGDAQRKEKTAAVVHHHGCEVGGFAAAMPKRDIERIGRNRVGFADRRKQIHW